MIAIVNEVHCIALRIQGWMLKQLGFQVYIAGGSFSPLVPNYHFGNIVDPEIFSGVMEVSQAPRDALFLDTHPETEKRFRQAGLQNPILIVWQMPVGPEWVRDNLRPGPGVGSLGWSTSVGREIARMSVCPNDHFWPAYPWLESPPPRESWSDSLITVVENAAGWSNLPVLEGLRDHPESRLELFGGGPPGWARKIPQQELYSKIRSSLAMYHLKPFDTPGLAVMEAALQGVPTMFPKDWVEKTESQDIFEDGVSCLIVDTDVGKVLEATRRLKDPDFNRTIGLEAQRRMREATDWKKNSMKLMKLIQSIIKPSGARTDSQLFLNDLVEFAQRVRMMPDERPAFLRDEMDEPEPATFYYRFLYHWARERKPAVMVDTGTFQGHTAIHLAEGNPKGRVITIDPNPEATGHVAAFGKRNIVTLTGKPVDLFQKVKELAGTIDLLFIDSEHKMPDVYDEYRVYRSLVRKGGMILIDDIHINPDLETLWSKVVDPKVELNDLHYKGFGASIKA